MGRFLLLYGCIFLGAQKSNATDVKSKKIFSFVICVNFFGGCAPPFVLNLIVCQAIIIVSAGFSSMGCEDPVPASEFNQIARFVRLF